MFPISMSKMSREDFRSSAMYNYHGVPTTWNLDIFDCGFSQLADLKLLVWETGSAML